MSDLLDCPFCGGIAEMDTRRSYRNISTGQLGRAVSIYCMSCNAEMTFCLADTPELSVEEIADLATEQWNARTKVKTERSLTWPKQP